MYKYFIKPVKKRYSNGDVRVTEHVNLQRKIVYYKVKKFKKRNHTRVGQKFICKFKSRNSSMNFSSGNLNIWCNALFIFLYYL